MQYRDTPLDDGYIEREWQPAGTDELAKFGKVIGVDLPPTHKFTVTIKPGRGPKELPSIITACRPLPLADIARATKDFEELSHIQMRSLMARYKLSVAPPVPGQPKLDDKAAMKAVLLAKLQQEPDVAPKQGLITNQSASAPTIVSPELDGKTDPELETMAGELGVVEEYKRQRRRSKAAAIAVIQRAMDKQEPAEA